MAALSLVPGGEALRQAERAGDRLSLGVVYIGMHAVRRSAWVWIGLLGAIESMDVLTTAAGRAQGAVESMPLRAAVMDAGGIGLFIFVKVALVAVGAITVLLALRWVRGGRPGAGVVLAFAMSAIWITTVALEVVSLHNAVLLQSLQGPA